MTNATGRLAALCLCLGLAACGAPRGAGFQSEVLAAAKTQDGAAAEDGLPAGFAVVPVTRATQAQLQRWPAVGGGGHSWIRRQEQPASLIIQPGDRISVSVWDAEENSLLAGPGQRVAQLQETQVSLNGAIFLPFVGEMRVAGMAPNTARERIEERYAAAIPSAQVQVTVAPGRGNTANLVGGVATPGVYPLEDRNVTLLGLLSLGGGVQPELANPQVRLFRGDKVYGISLDRLYADPALDTTLQGGDRVIVAGEERYFLSLGATGTETQHIFPRDRVSALDAMALIGGLSENRANPKGILILREYPASARRSDGSGPPEPRVVFTLDLTTADGLFSARNFLIMPGDLVYATESRLSSAVSVLSLIALVLRTGEQAATP